jgi:hypothetical protein
MSTRLALPSVPATAFPLRASLFVEEPAEDGREPVRVLDLGQVAAVGGPREHVR